jgi:uncharacterized membrane protein YoaK (UPF0700 family)
MRGIIVRVIIVGLIPGSSHESSAIGYDEVAAIAHKENDEDPHLEGSRVNSGEMNEKRVTSWSSQKGWSGTVSTTVDRATRALPFVLSVIAGSTDIIGFLGLNGLFTAHITGNIVVLTAHIVAGDPAIISYILSVPVFMLVLFLTRLAAGGLERTRVVSTLPPLLLLQLLSLTAFLVLCVTRGPWTDANAILAIIAGMFGVAAMAIQNALVQISLRNTPTTAVMTTNVTHFMLDLGELLVGRDQAAIGKARIRVIHTLPVIFGFTIGCGLGATCEAAAGLWSLALPTGLALLAFAMGFRWLTAT